VERLAISPGLVTGLAIAMVVYVILMYAVAYRIRSRINSTEDFLVAGRRLPLSLAWATLLATWFGAGTMLTVTDAVRESGLQRMALDPLGAGACLIITALFFARPMWEMRLLTVPDFFRQRFGPTAELVSAVVLVPSYFGWIAAQFVALAGMLELFFGISPTLGIPLVAVVGMGYTLLGGMWSVTLTDAIQMTIVALGLGVLGLVTLNALGQGSPVAGAARLLDEVPASMLSIVPTRDPAALMGWVGVFVVGALGNVPGQDLMQRVFSSRSSSVARRACLIAGVAYLVMGFVPPMLGLAANLLMPGSKTGATLPALAGLFLDPWLAALFVLVVLSAVLSTVDSAILSPASVMAQNVLPRLPLRRFDALQLNRLSVVFVTAVSVVFAFLGESAYGLLEGAYELTLVSLLVPLAIGIYRPARPGPPAAAVAAMATGTGLWLLHQALGWSTALGAHLAPLPVSLFCTAAALVVHLAVRSPSPNGRVPS